MNYNGNFELFEKEFEEFEGNNEEILEKLIKFVENQLNDLTFEELYVKSNKILNLMIYSNNSSLITIFNYITTPNVIVKTAMFASLTSYYYPKNQLLIKNLNNEINLMINLDLKFIKSIEYKKIFKDNNNNKSSSERLIELFNVNYFIICQSNFFLLNNLNYTNKSIFVKLINLEIIFRINLLLNFKIFNKNNYLIFLKKNLLNFNQNDNEYFNNSNLLINPNLKDFLTISVLNNENFKENLIKLGEINFWKNYSNIRIACLIEFKLDELYNENKLLNF